MKEITSWPDLQREGAENKSLLVLFYCAWCSTCKEILAYV
jgi:thiol:disulfide interchange protein